MQQFQSFHIQHILVKSFNHKNPNLTFKKPFFQPYIVISAVSEAIMQIYDAMPICTFAQTLICSFSDRISAWIILLPLYMLFMIPWTLVLIVYR